MDVNMTACVSGYVNMNACVCVYACGFMKQFLMDWSIQLISNFEVCYNLLPNELDTLLRV